MATALAPVVHGAPTGAWWSASAARGHLPLVGVDAIALAMAIGFARLAIINRCRARDGEPNSVWAD